MSCVRFILVLLFLISISCSKDETSNQAETAHFLFKWKEGEATSSEIEKAQNFAEEIYTSYAVFFGPENMPVDKTVVNLDGDAFAENGQNPNIPFVDENREIFLYRFATGYFGELPHEYVHVIRFFKGWSSDGFLEEGIAEAISHELFPNNVGFSLYGFSTTVAAGTWLENENLIPLLDLKNRHFDLNLTCSAQSYPLRADFFQYLFDEFGKEIFMSFLYSSDAGSDTSYELFFGKSLALLEEEWIQNLTLRLNNLPVKDEQILSYSTKIDQLNFYICEAGSDF